MNPSHYALIAKLMGVSMITSIEQNYGAGIWYNTMIQLPHVPFQIKYGIISSTLFKQDLLDWKYLYVAGRLHKPVRLLQEPSEEGAFGDVSLEEMMERNRRYALSCSLLMLPPAFSVADVLIQISGLSYLGDFRMQVGEHPDKVQNLVQGDVAGFFDLYQPHLKELRQQGFLRPDTGSGQEGEEKLDLLLSTPSSPSLQLQDLQAIACSKASFEPSQHSLLLPPSMANVSHELLGTRIGERIASNALSQSLKGIVTAGVRKSMVYAGLKVLKKFKR